MERPKQLNNKYIKPHKQLAMGGHPKTSMPVKHDLNMGNNNNKTK